MNLIMRGSPELEAAGRKKSIRCGWRRDGNRRCGLVEAQGTVGSYTLSCATLTRHFGWTHVRQVQRMPRQERKNEEA